MLATVSAPTFPTSTWPDLLIQHGAPLWRACSVSSAVVGTLGLKEVRIWVFSQQWWMGKSTKWWCGIYSHGQWYKDSDLAVEGAGTSICACWEMFRKEGGPWNRSYLKAWKRINWVLRWLLLPPAVTYGKLGHLETGAYSAGQDHQPFHLACWSSLLALFFPSSSPRTTMMRTKIWCNYKDRIDLVLTELPVYL